MGCQLIDSGSLGRVLDNFPEHYRRHAMAPDLSRLVDSPKEAAVFDPACFSPAVNRLLHPKWNWNRPNMPGFAVEVGDYPVLFSELSGTDRKGEKFTAPQSTTNQKSKDGMVSLAPETFALGFQQQRAALIGSEPVAQSDSDSAHAFDPANARGKLWTEQAGIRGLVRDAPDCGQAEVYRCGCEAPLFQVNPVSKNNGAIEGKSWF